MKSHNKLKKIALVASVLTLANASATVVFSELNFADGSITLHNNGTALEALDGWRFCSHDLDQQRVYSSTSALNGITIGAGDSLTLSFASFNFISTIDTANSASIGLYTSSNFGSSTALETFIQYTPVGNTTFGTSQARTVTAVDAGVWDANNSFVEVNASDTRITLNNLGVSTGASSFSASAVPEPSSIALFGLGALGLLARRKR